MARLVRVCPKGVAQHVIQRGNNRQVCFGGDQDMKAYLSWLKEYSVKYKVDIHAWVLMTNHVHLLCTPNEGGGLSKMMQSLGRSYVRYFNYSYARSGTLWEGRFKSCLVQDEKYLLEVYRYIELNPVRAKMVDDPSDYSWSSYAANALGVESDLQTQHAIYKGLALNKSDRLIAYRSLFEAHVSNELLTEIRTCVNRSLALGDNRFKQEIEALTKQRVTARKVGRPVKEK